MRNVTFHPFKRICGAAALLLLNACIANAAPTIQTPLTLINVSSGAKTNFVNGMTLKQGVTYKLRATANAQTRSVRLYLDRALPVTQNAVPYTFALPTLLGPHSGSITPYPKDNGKGPAGKSVPLSFTIAAPTPTPTPRPTSTPTPAPSLTPSPTPSPTASATVTPSPSPTATPTPSPSATLTPPPTPTIAPTPTPSPSASPTATPLFASATVSWSASEGATGYIVVWGNSSGSYSNKFDCGNELTARLVNHFTPGATYYFAVEAYNAKATSAPSTEVSYTP